MPFEIVFKIESSEYNEIVFLQEYKDNFYIVAGGESREGTNYKKWAYPQTKDREPGNKAIPVSVKIGRRHEAVKILEDALNELRGAKAF